MNHIGLEGRLDVGDKSYRLSRYERRYLRQLLRWAREQLPDPLAMARKVLPILSPDIASNVATQAIQAAKQMASLHSPDLQRILTDTTGIAHALALLLADANGLTHKEALAVAEQARQEWGEDYLIARLEQAQGSFQTAPDLSKRYYQELGLMPFPEQTDSKPIPWLETDRHIVQNFYYKPWDLDRLTLAEYVTLFTKPQDGNQAEALQMVECYKQLTPQQRLTLCYRHLTCM